MWAASSEFVSLSIPSWQISTAHVQPFSGARDLAFCLKVPLDSLLVWASSEGSGETARMRRLAWTFAARIGDKYQIRLTRSMYVWMINIGFTEGRPFLNVWRNYGHAVNTQVPVLWWYCKNTKNLDTPKIICCNHPKIWTMLLYHRVMQPKDADRMADSVDPNQTVPSEAVWSGSTLFAQTYLSENLGSLW